MINIWMALSSQAISEFISKRSDPSGYDGPMDNRTFRILKTMHNADEVQRLFKVTPPINGNVYTLFSLYTDNDNAESAVNYISAQWPNHVIVLGAWVFETGEQLRDEEGSIIYPIHPQTWRIIPGAASNNDLLDVNVVFGQASRDFS